MLPLHLSHQDSALPLSRRHAHPRGMVANTQLAAHQPSRVPSSATPKSRPAKVTGKVATAVALMIEDGLAWNDAAVKAGLTVRAMRLALERPHVMAFLRARKQVFRETVSTANILRLAQIRDAADNMPAVNAIKALEQIADDPAASSSVRHAPGVVIQIVSNDADRTVTVNARELRTDKGEQDQ